MWRINSFVVISWGSSPSQRCRTVLLEENEIQTVPQGVSDRYPESNESDVARLTSTMTSSWLLSAHS